MESTYVPIVRSRLDELRRLIREAISLSVKERLTGFLEEVETLSWEIAYGDKEAIKQLKHVLGETNSLSKFLERNDRLAYLVLKKVIASATKVVEMTKFWNVPSFLNKKKHVESLRKQAADVEREIETANRLMDIGSFSGMTRRDNSTRYDVPSKSGFRRTRNGSSKRVA